MTYPRVPDTCIIAITVFQSPERRERRREREMPSSLPALIEQQLLSCKRMRGSQGFWGCIEFIGRTMDFYLGSEIIEIFYDIFGR